MERKHISMFGAAILFLAACGSSEPESTASAEVAQTETTDIATEPELLERTEPAETADAEPAPEQTETPEQTEQTEQTETTDVVSAEGIVDFLSLATGPGFNSCENIDVDAIIDVLGRDVALQTRTMDTPASPYRSCAFISTENAEDDDVVLVDIDILPSDAPARDVFLVHADDLSIFNPIDDVGDEAGWVVDGFFNYTTSLVRSNGFSYFGSGRLSSGSGDEVVFQSIPESDSLELLSIVAEGLEPVIPADADCERFDGDGLTFSSFVYEQATTCVAVDSDGSRFAVLHSEGPDSEQAGLDRLEIWTGTFSVELPFKLDSAPFDVWSTQDNATFSINEESSTWDEIFGFTESDFFVVSVFGDAALDQTDDRLVALAERAVS